uniref:Interleukin-18 n=1 Tax=Anguilla anguilla TaxID=7936 RepID=A0A0E9X6I1_ANGAN
MSGMAVDEQRVKLAAICEDEIFFEVMNTDYESDGYKKDKKCLTRVIQNNKKQFLVVDAECLRFEERNKRESRKEECQFSICCYQNSDSGISTGVPVILMGLDKGENRIICCCDNAKGKGVYAKPQEQPLPTYIEESSHNAVFFLQSVKGQSNFYRIKSSLWPNLFLGFEEEGDDLVKLVLREAGEDVIEGLQLLKP